MAEAFIQAALGSFHSDVGIPYLIIGASAFVLFLCFVCLCCTHARALRMMLGKTEEETGSDGTDAGVRDVHAG